MFISQFFNKTIKIWLISYSLSFLCSEFIIAIKQDDIKFLISCITFIPIFFKIIFLIGFTHVLNEYFSLFLKTELSRDEKYIINSNFKIVGINNRK